MQEILREATARTQSMVELLRALVQIESPSDDPAGVAAAGERLRSEFDAAGLTTDLLPAPGVGPILRARGGTGRRPIMLLGHIDTVWPLGTLKARPVRIEGDVFHGPGAYDMKAGLVVALFAIRALAERGLLPAVTAFFTPYEEVDCEAYKQELLAEMRACRAVLDFEPAAPGGGVKTGRKGSGTFVLRAHGKAAHAGAELANGRNAILELSRRILEVDALTSAETGASVNVGVIRGGTRPNVVPEFAEAEIDVRYPSWNVGRGVEQRLRDLQPELDGVRLELTGALHYPPLERNAAVLGVYEDARSVAAELGADLGEIQTGGASEAAFASELGLPTLDGLGADGAGAHAEHEHVLISSLAPRVALTAGLLARLGARE